MVEYPTNASALGIDNDLEIPQLFGLHDPFLHEWMVLSNDEHEFFPIKWTD